MRALEAKGPSFLIPVTTFHGAIGSALVAEYGSRFDIRDIRQAAQDYRDPRARLDSLLNPEKDAPAPSVREKEAAFLQYVKTHPAEEVTIRPQPAAVVKTAPISAEERENDFFLNILKPTLSAM
jgi:hypothetical protein